MRITWIPHCRARPVLEQESNVQVNFLGQGRWTTSRQWEVLDGFMYEQEPHPGGGSHPGNLRGDHSLVERVPDLTCCGEADWLAAARDAAVAARPDLVMLDLDFPDGEALELVREWAEAQPMIRTLVFRSRGGSLRAPGAARGSAGLPHETREPRTGRGGNSCRSARSNSRRSCG